MSAHSVSDRRVLPSSSSSSRRRARSRVASSSGRTRSSRSMIQLLLEHGRDVTSKEIAEAAGIAEGTIFRAFGDKETLLNAAVERYLRSARAAHGAAVDRPRPAASRRRSRGSSTLMSTGSATSSGSCSARRPARSAAEARETRHEFAADRRRAARTETAQELRVAPERVAHYVRMVAFSQRHPGLQRRHGVQHRRTRRTLIHARRRGPIHREIQAPSRNRPDAPQAHHAVHEAVLAVRRRRGGVPARPVDRVAVPADAQRRHHRQRRRQGRHRRTSCDSAASCSASRSCRSSPRSPPSTSAQGRDGVRPRPARRDLPQGRRVQRARGVEVRRAVADHPQHERRAAGADARADDLHAAGLRADPRDRRRDHRRCSRTCSSSWLIAVAVPVLLIAIGLIIVPHGAAVPPHAGARSTR